MQFSIIVPVYRVEDYLDQCVKSILNQTYKDFELILVDDGSPDNCPQKCDDYKKEDSRIKVVHKKNGGLTSARKAGMMISSGNYVVVVDSDDWIDDNLLQVLSDTISKSNCDVVCYNYYIADEKKTKYVHQYSEGLYLGDNLAQIKESFLYDSKKKGLNYGSLPYSICVKAVRKELYKECQQLVPDNVVKGEDLLFTINLLNKCKSIYMIDFVGYYYRVNNMSITHCYEKKDVERLMQIAEKIIAVNPYDEIHLNKTYIYTFVSFWDLILGFAKDKHPASEFVLFIKKIYPPIFDVYFEKINLSKYTLKDKIKINLVRKHKWHFVYLYVNCGI